MQTPPDSTDLESLSVEPRSAHAREEATREILNLLIQSREDQFPVFDAVLKNATRLCNAPIAGLFLANEARTRYQLVASRGAKRQFVEAFEEDPPDLDPERFAAARAMIEKRVVHVEDLASPTLYGADAAHRIVCTQTEGIRTTLFVPLIWNDQSIGAIGVWRRAVRPFHDDEINLVETFAAQAVIAIENVRQFKEVQARLTREQALAEILTVISESRDDEKPVFDAILQNVTRLCQASDAALLLGRPDEPNVTLAALLRQDAPRPEQNVEVIAETNRVPMKMDPAIHTSAEAICSGTIVHILDLSESAGYQAGEPSFRSMVDDFGIRTCLSVPLFDAQGALGAINLHRRLAQVFSEDEIALGKSFAAQAVIAIENVRQFRELQERLEREEATRDVLQVISMSRSDPTPVFDVILKNAARLSGAPLANLCLLSNSERSHWRLAAHFGEGLRHLSVGKTSPLEKATWVPAVTMRTGRVNQHRRPDRDQSLSSRVIPVASPWSRRKACCTILVSSHA